jgi:hypothetical protein
MPGRIALEGHPILIIDIPERQGGNFAEMFGLAVQVLKILDADRPIIIPLDLCFPQ